MPRIAPVESNNSDALTVELLDGIKKKMGSVPNILQTMAHSLPATKAYLAMSQSLAAGSISPRVREQIALAVGESNSCDYCVAAHTVLGKSAGLSQEETVLARQGRASDAREQVAVEFVQQLAEQRGHVQDDAVQRLTDAGYSQAEVIELVAYTALNIFTNYFNHVAETEVDFPPVLALQSA